MNFPVSGGTSGHLLGGALAAILVGPWAAVLILASVIGVQALVFQDGGLAALGANIFNMGIVSAFTGYAIYKVAASVAGNNRSITVAGTFVGAWCGVMLAATLCSIDLAVSGSSDWDVVFPAMLGVHALIGIGEGLISAATVAFVLSTRPDLMGETAQPARRMEFAKEARS
jgi:cobalt/nickel transport system permease protein